SDRLKLLAGQLQAVEAELADTANRLKQREAEQAQTLLKISQAEVLQAQTRQRLDVPEAEAHARHHGLIADWRREALGEHTLSVESCDAREQDLRRWLQERIDADDKRLARLGERIVRAMAEYKDAF